MRIQYASDLHLEFLKFALSLLWIFGIHLYNKRRKDAMNNVVTQKSKSRPTCDALLFYDSTFYAILWVSSHYGNLDSEVQEDSTNQV